MPHSDNHIFVGYKALGFISNHVPISVGYYRKRHEPFVVTCVGKAFHTFTCPKLGITNISDSLPEPISLLKVDNKFVYAASGNDVHVFIQWKKVLHSLRGHIHPITHLLPFGDHLVSIDQQNFLKVWNTTLGELYSEMVVQASPSCLIHPTHYTNKILIAHHSGSMQLINLLKAKVLYEFSGWSCAITALQQSQAVDVVGVGLKDGHLHLHHLRDDHTLMSFRQDWGAVTSICFRTDVDYVMMAGSESGNVGVWHLEEKRLMSQSMKVHEGPVTSLVSITGQSLVLSSSNDNTLKTWVCEMENCKLRLLNSRSGHYKPPSFIRFHDDSTILSAGKDCTFRSFSTLHESNNRSFGKTRMRNLKRRGAKQDDVDDSNLIGHITSFVSQTARQSDWDGIVCCHDDQTVATTWNYHKSTLGKHHFSGSGSSTSGVQSSDQKNATEQKDKAVAECVDVSSCGNFTVVGFSNGVAVKFNMQSGLQRGSYRHNNDDRHHANISGVFVDGLNKTLVTLGWDGWLKLWSFASTKPQGSMQFEGVVLRKGVLCRSNNLLAVACDDFVVMVVDIVAQRVVRKFKQHKNDVTDMTYGRQGRWLITSCMDQCIRVFDLLSSTLVDVIRTATPATSITLSPTNELLASTHVDQLGIFLWFNTRLYHRNDVITINDDDDVIMVDMPRTRCRDENDDGEEDDDKNVASLGTSNNDILDDHNQIADLLTLEDRGHLKVNALLHYDLIKERNKPKEGVKKNEKAPFFLPSSLTQQPLFVSEVIQKDQKEEDVDKTPKMIPVMPTKLASILNNYQMECGDEDEEKEDYDGEVEEQSRPIRHYTPLQIKHFECIEVYLLSLSTGLLDTELNFLTSDSTPDSTHHLSIMLNFLAYWIDTNRHADLVNAVVVRMTELNPSALTSHSRILAILLFRLQTQMQVLRRQHHSTQALLSFVSGTANFFPNV